MFILEPHLPPRVRSSLGRPMMLLLYRPLLRLQSPYRPSKLLVFLSYLYLLSLIHQPYIYQQRCRLRLLIELWLLPSRDLRYHPQEVSAWVGWLPSSSPPLISCPTSRSQLLNTLLLQVYIFLFSLLFLLHLSLRPSVLDILLSIFWLSYRVVPYFFSVFLVLGIKFVEYMNIYIISHLFSCSIWRALPSSPSNS